MCSECFIKYVSSKPVKRIESYRLKDDAAQQPRRLLLPVSGGISSVVLLQILDQSLQRQLVKRGRTAYELLIVTVESPWLENERNILSCFHALRQKFSLHHFSLISLTSIVELDHNFQQDVAALSNIARAGAQDILDFLVSNAVTPSARTHLINALLTRLVAAFAEFNKCDAVLWGHSSSCLAAKSLAAVVEGNGGALPLHISDGPSFLGVPSYFPLRDLFKPELVSYANSLPELFSETVALDNADSPRPPVRDSSIHDLLSDYVGSQGEKYPSIMANIVRTSSKLQAPRIPRTFASCLLCAMPILNEENRQSRADLDQGSSRTCFTCHRVWLEISRKAFPIDSAS